ncbi:MAG: phosphotransferase [Oscillospiraceae bacterium]|nr:phosphotransferase [Oscillospiraceae bacterium]
METLLERSDKKIIHEGDTVVKIFSADYSKANVLNEALNQALVEETGLNIPHLREVKMIEGMWAIVIDYIPGKTLQQLMEENPDKLDEYMDLFVDLQCKVLSKRSPKLRKIKDKMIGKMSECKIIDATQRYELQTRISSMPKHDKVCHGDFNPSNIIITPDGEPYIIDWSHATRGNASADAARTYLLFVLEGKEDLAKKYITTFSKKADIPLQLIQKWMPVVAASQSLKGKEEEMEILSSWANVVDYE